MHPGGIPHIRDGLSRLHIPMHGAKSQTYYPTVPLPIILTAIPVRLPRNPLL